MMKSEDAIEPTYPIARGNKINDVSTEAYDIAVALIDYIDGNFKQLKTWCLMIKSLKQINHHLKNFII